MVLKSKPKVKKVPVSKPEQSTTVAPKPVTEPIEETSSGVFQPAVLSVSPEPDVELDDLSSDLGEEATEDADDITDELSDEFVDNTFRGELADDADDVDLTEDLSEELGTEKFFRDKESGLEDDEDDLRSW